MQAVAQERDPPVAVAASCDPPRLNTTNTLSADARSSFTVVLPSSTCGISGTEHVPVTGSHTVTSPSMRNVTSPEYASMPFGDTKYQSAVASRRCSHSTGRSPFRQSDSPSPVHVTSGAIPSTTSLTPP